MFQKLHKNARTTYATRSYIKESPLSVADLVRELGLNEKTVLKWKKRDDLQDKSSQPHRLRTSLTDTEEDLIVYERKAHKKTLFEIYDALEGEIAHLYPMKIYRVLSRWGLGVLPPELVAAERQIRKFRRYTIGYIHIDLIYTPKLTLPDGRKVRYYVFSAIDRVSKLAYVWISDSKTAHAASTFLSRVLAFYPYPIHYILTDNGREFTSPKTHPRKKSQTHPFDVICKTHKIDHRRTKIAHPWTNGMVERFNRKLKVHVVRRHLFQDRRHLERELTQYINTYNFVIRLQGLSGKTPVQYLIDTYSHIITKAPQRIVS
jgi:transposase InsO family protein